MSVPDVIDVVTPPSDRLDNSEDRSAPRRIEPPLLQEEAPDGDSTMEDERKRRETLPANEFFVWQQLQQAKRAVDPIIDREFEDGLRCFPDIRDRVDKAVECRRKLVHLCLEQLAEALVSDGDFRQPYLEAKKMVIELSRLLDQYRIVGKEVSLVQSDRLLSEDWQASTNTQNLPDFIPGSGFHKFSRFDAQLRSGTLNYTHDEQFEPTRKTTATTAPKGGSSNTLEKEHNEEKESLAATSSHADDTTETSSSWVHVSK